ncbi:hypothetical protein D3C75_1226800 [compost metagenome]
MPFRLTVTVVPSAKLLPPLSSRSLPFSTALITSSCARMSMLSCGAVVLTIMLWVALPLLPAWSVRLAVNVTLPSARE